LTVADTQIKRHPIRGALFGLMLGISAAYYLFFQFTVFGFDSVTGVITRFVVIVLLGMVVGIVWAYVAPPKRPKGEPPPDAPEAEEGAAEA
jgi:hypothetical protein